MRTVGVYEAKTHLPAILKDVERGEQVTITVRGRPVAQLWPVAPTSSSVGDAIQAMLDAPLVEGVAGDAVLAWIAEGRK